MGAVAGGGLRVLNADVLSRLGLRDELVDAVTDRAAAEVAERERAYRGDRPAPALRGRRVLLVDDGLATGATMRVAVRAVTGAGASPVVVAVPVAPPSACEALRALADEVVCLHTPSSFLAVGAWYEDFSETPDDEVRSLLGA
jgi:putative phosphoribosyl transferase